MEDIPMCDFVVKSLVHDYKVNFVDELKNTLIQEILPGDIAILDQKVLKLYDADLKTVLANIEYITIEANEKQKSYQGVMPIIDQLIKSGFRKNHRLIAIGGGITQDVTAFMASIMYRGVSWLFFPTTLLAQADSCIGSKTSINFGEFKNQVGGFYPPNKIFIYPPFVDTLDPNDFMSGIGEMLHYFIVAGKEDFELFRSLYHKARTEKEALQQLISRSLQIKKSYIEIDEFDKGPRQVFNYGHSFGHAIESLSHFDVPHGIAVAFGMDMSNYVSAKMGFIPDSIRNEIREVTKSIWTGFSIKNIDTQVFLKALSKDKKNVGKKLGLILNKGYGNIFKHIMEADETFASWIETYFKTELEAL
jgi:3-dehydroquinate synthase